MLQRHVRTHHVCLHSPSSMRGSFSVRRRNTAALFFVSPVGTPGPQQSTLTDAHSVWKQNGRFEFCKTRLKNLNYSGLNCRDKSCFEAGLPLQVTGAGPACRCKATQHLIQQAELDVQLRLQHYMQLQRPRALGVLQAELLVLQRQRT